MRHLTVALEAVNRLRTAVSSVTHLHPSGLRTMPAPQAALALFVAANCTIVAAPSLSTRAFNRFMSKKHLAGHHKGKDRGTFQSTVIDLFTACLGRPLPCRISGEKCLQCTCHGRRET